MQPTASDCSATMWVFGGSAGPEHADKLCTGPQKEVDAWPTFAELAALLPGHHIRLLLIGPDVPSELHGRSTAGGQDQKRTAGGSNSSCCL